MAITIDPTLPADSESPRQGASRIRNIVLQLLSLVNQGEGAAVTFLTNPFSIDVNGNVTVPTTLTVPAPTTGTQATTKAYVDAGDASTLATSQAYTNTQVAGINLTVPTVPATIISTTLLQTTVAPGASQSLLQVVSTPPAVPTNAQKYRAHITAQVFFTSTTSPGGLLCYLSDTASLFTTRNAGQQNFFVSDAQHHSFSVNFSAISDVTRTSSQGSVTFTITGIASSLGVDTNNVSILTHPTTDASTSSLVSVTWIPAQ